MKISLNITEAKHLVVKALNLPQDTMVEFVNKSAQASKILEVLRPFMFDERTFNPNQKIAAIKALRSEVPSYSLMNAKWFVIDLWPSSMDFVEKNDRMPEFDFAGNMS